MILKVREYRNRKPALSYREIAAILKKDIRQIYRWAQTKETTR